MNIKAIVVVTILLIVSIFGNVALAFNISNKSQEVRELISSNKEMQKQITKLNEGLEQAEGIIIDDQLSNNDEAKKIVEEFFNVQYEYNSETYKARFEKIKPFVNDEVYGQLTTAGIPEIPNIKFENNIKNLKVYLGAENNELSGLVLVDTVYTIEGVQSPETTQIFHISLSNNEGDKKIISLKTIGTFTSTSVSES